MNDICIVGLGVVGSAISESFNDKGIVHYRYDKYKGMGRINDILFSKLIIACLPTPNIEGAMYNLNEIYSLFDFLEENYYSGEICIKSTMVPGTTKNFDEKYSFRIYNSPEFLSEKTAFEDFHNQNHVVIGSNYLNTNYEIIMRNNYSENISLIGPSESESMKIFCNSFYAMKIMIFNEFYNICKNKSLEFSIIKDAMLKNNWINEMHTMVPGTDGNFGFGGMCLPKDLNSLCEFADRSNSLNEMMKAAINENKKVRSL